MAALAIVATLLIQATSAASADIATDEHLERTIRHHTATLTAITSLSGEQLAGFGAGYALPMRSVGDDRVARIVNAVEEAMGVAEIYLKDIPPGSQRILMLFPRYSVTVMAGPLGESGEIIELGEMDLALSTRPSAYVAAYPGDWRSQTTIMTLRDIWLSAAKPETYSKTLDYKPPVLRRLNNPPGIDQLLSKSPTDPSAKAEWLRKQAFDLLAPIGEMWLERDSSVPFTYADFAGGRFLNAADTSARQKEWLKQLYADHLTKTGAEKSSWEDLGKVNARLKVEFLAAIAVVQLVSDQSEIALQLGKPDSYSPRERMEWQISGKAPLKFAEGQAPPLYQNVKGKGMGWVLTR